MVQWRGRRRSANVEDVRGQRAAGARRGGGLKLKGGIGTIVLLGVVYFMGGDVSQVLGLLLGGGASSPGAAQSAAPAQPRAVGNDDGAQFVSVILAETEDTWSHLFQTTGARYPQPKLRLFSEAINSQCGFNTSAVGPFYCPPDQRVYLDLTFFGELSKLGAPGDFAQAYVIAHEVGHHVQNVTGVLQSVQQRTRGLSEIEANKLQVLVELQADCYAGIWANHANAKRDFLEQGDVEEGLIAASSIGDDTLQKRAGRSVRPESFTHGSSAKRVAWFRKGFDSGKIESCDTFRQAGVPLALAAGNRANAFVATNNANATNSVAAAFLDRRSDIQVSGDGVVIKVLPDDLDGSRHQKFILRIAPDHSLLVAHNIDLAERLDNLRKGDQVEFFGEYEWTDRGGVLHWTHHDPAGRHIGGWLAHNGHVYR